MKTVYVITMWSGGRPAKKWKSYEIPALLSNGTGVEFVNVDTKLSVKIIGSISVEEFESGKEEIESRFFHDTMPEEPLAQPRDDSNIERLF